MAEYMPLIILAVKSGLATAVVTQVFSLLKGIFVEIKIHNKQIMKDKKMTYGYLTPLNYDRFFKKIFKDTRISKQFLEDTTNKEDNILFTGQIYNLTLNAELVVLSACETGLGKIREGEGVIGLTRALLYAGTKNITVSLWPVDDVGTKELMKLFYENMLNDKSENLKYAKYLSKAKLQLIQNELYAHPFFWSPFILIGE